MEGNYIVTKSNKLISANYDLSLQEQKIILTLASMVQPQDTEFKEYEFKIKDFIKLLGIEDKKKYIAIPKITKDLMKKVFEIRQDKKIIQLAWLNSAEYELGTGIVRLQFSPKLKPYMLELKELYTSYKLENVLSLKSKYSIRLYEILKSNSFKKQVTIELEEIKGMVGAKEKAYNTYANFKNKVIFKAQEELKEKTDISFEFEEIKTGRKVTSIKFIIKSNIKPIDELLATRRIEVPKNDFEGSTDLINAIKGIFKEDITELDAKKIFDAAKGDINIVKEKYRLAQTVSKIDNIVGWMISAIKEDYKTPISKTKTSHFNNFEQRQYNFEELERKLLGWD